MPRGGARKGAGRKPKPLADKVLEGNPGKRDLKVLSFDKSENESAGIPPAPLYLDALVSGGDKALGAELIYELVYGWLKRIKCFDLLSPMLIQEYSVLMARWLECEAKNTEYGLFGGLFNSEKENPHIKIGLMYLEKANEIWEAIWSVVAANSLEDFKKVNPHDSVMSSILS